MHLVIHKQRREHTLIHYMSNVIWIPMVSTPRVSTHDRLQSFYTPRDLRPFLNSLAKVCHRFGEPLTSKMLNILCMHQQLCRTWVQRKLSQLTRIRGNSNYNIEQFDHSVCRIRTVARHEIIALTTGITQGWYSATWHEWKMNLSHFLYKLDRYKYYLSFHIIITFYFSRTRFCLANKQFIMPVFFFLFCYCISGW